jgi:hypothetical protein
MNAQDNEQTQLLREILKWIRFAGMKGVKEQLDSALETDQKKTVYQLSDGSKGIIEIGKVAGIPGTSTIFRYWKSWSKLGLGDYIAVKGGDRFKRFFDLEDLGIEVPEIKTKGTPDEYKEEQTEQKPEVIE